MQDLYKNIRKRRKDLNMSQQELAELVGYSGKSMISQIERGVIDLPSTMITKIAKALHCTESYLMGWTDIVGPLDLEEAAFGHADLADSGHAEKIAYKDYDIEEVRKAMELWLSYEKADPNIRSAVETLLKPKPQES